MFPRTAPRLPSSNARPWALLFLIAGVVAAACSGTPEAPPAPPAAVDAAHPARDPATWVPAVVAHLDERVRALAMGETKAVFERALEAKHNELHETTSLQRLYGGADAAFRYVGEFAPTPLGAHLIERLTAAKSDGLSPILLHVDELPKAKKRLDQARKAIEAVPPPPVPTGAELERVFALARKLPTGATPAADERALVEHLLAADSPLPAWQTYFTDVQPLVLEASQARARMELRLADGLLFYGRLMSPGNASTEDRLARRALVASAPSAPAAPASEQAEAEHGGLGDDSAAPAPVTAPPGATLPPVLADRRGFLFDRLVSGVSGITDPASLDTFLTAAEPKHPQYAPLKAALARYRAVADRDGGFVKVGSRGALGPGARGPVVEKLQKRLAQEDYLKGEPTGVYDAATTAAVSRFQAAHQMPETGRMGDHTWDQLDVPLVVRVRNIDRALDAIRESHVDEDTYFVAVNIPDFMLDVWKDGKRLLRMKVVVGKSQGTVCDPKTRHLTLAYATPVLSAEISRIVYAPYWLITKDIKEKEYDTERAKDPLFYERHGFEVIDRGRPSEWVRQMPSPANSLGFVKILFPNQFAVYLHDTPTKSLFENRVRSASHGCVRLEQPRDLAQLLMEQDSQWDAPRFEQLYNDWMAMGKLLTPYTDEHYHQALKKAMDLQQEIPLKTPVPVHIEYYTARVADDGIVEFLDDIYDRDVGRWTRKNAPVCVPEGEQAVAGSEDVGEEVDRLEREAAVIEGRAKGLKSVMERLAEGDKNQQFLASRGRGLFNFRDRQKVMVDSVRAANDKVVAAVEKHKGEWTDGLKDQALKVKRLLDGLEKMNEGAKRTCAEIEAKR